MWRRNTDTNSNSHANTHVDTNTHTDTGTERDRLGGRFDTGRSRISFRWQRVELGGR
jgi:hypothetical protein